MQYGRHPLPGLQQELGNDSRNEHRGLPVTAPGELTTDEGHDVGLDALPLPPPAAEATGDPQTEDIAYETDTVAEEDITLEA
ncbi:hypothetical protein [Nocardia sp. AB354]|uniref:hypothetical protein n=1 Tax=Nocardia sp. AB354 TaxID=3413283 RepID=UPI003C1ECDFC